MTERELTPEIAAGLFGKAKQEQQPAQEPSPEPTPKGADPPADDRAEAARLIGLDPGLAHRLRGDSVQELVADAGRLAATLEEIRPKPEPKQTSFDAGVRESPPPPPETHEEWLIRLLQEGGGQGGGRW
jgi:hypothetical protein